MIKTRQKQLLDMFKYHNRVIPYALVQGIGVKIVANSVCKLRQKNIIIEFNRKSGYTLVTPINEIDINKAKIKDPCSDCGERQSFVKGLCQRCYQRIHNDNCGKERSRCKQSREDVKYIKPVHDPIHLQQMTGQRLEKAVNQMIADMGR